MAPEHWTVEVLSAIRGNVLGGKITQRHAEDAVAALARLDPVVPPTRVLLPRTWELRSNLTTSDAAYVAAAEAYGCALLTTDARLSRGSGNPLHGQRHRLIAGAGPAPCAEGSGIQPRKGGSTRVGRLPLPSST
ncbi:type II toxin-antitoxin system VapC family toxin [Streptomyces sp. NPDC004647]|uniref:type II toxin-antitoxin system VapC family toxin n=1 Tax=Streptomyces sp. NPDC004647 TaxID=3154671 RepID=UPI0033AAA696